MTERIEERLAAMPLFESLSAEQLRWVAEHGRVEEFAAGERVLVQGAPSEALWVILDGEITCTREAGGEERVLVTSDEPGAWAGAVPFVDETYQLSARTLRPSRLLRLDLPVVRDMLMNGYPIASHLLAGLSWGVRNMEAVSRQQEKLESLGRLAAGLAHELNNPAASARRAAAQLREILAAHDAAAAEIGTAVPAPWDVVEDLRGDLARLQGADALDPLATGDAEDRMLALLEEQGVEDPWDLAATLVEAGLDGEWVEQAARRLPDGQLGPVLCWLATGEGAARLIGEVESAAHRIAELVGTVKTYSYMDKAPVQEIDLNRGLDETLRVLKHKLGAVTVTRDYADDLPRVKAHGGDLNQVWTNLIDNAIDAMDGGGRLEVRTHRDGEKVVVEISDDGSGIPEDVRSRIFDPFFTTKGVGKGTGLGLDISRRIITSGHGGSISVDSEPGATTFRVVLPVHPRGAGPAARPTDQGHGR